MKRARLAIMHLTQSRASSVSVSTSTESLDGLVQQYPLALPTTDSTAASVQPEAERVTIEEVRAALCDLCERADGCIVLLHDIGKRLRDEIVMKLGGIPAEVKCAGSRSCDKKDFMVSLATHLKGTFGVVVKRNTTGKKIADHPRFKGLYAMNLRMIE